jgi:hypothetical protein
MYDTNFHKLNPQTCVKDVTADGTNTISITLESERSGIESPVAPRTSSGS